MLSECNYLHAPLTPLASIDRTRFHQADALLENSLYIMSIPQGPPDTNKAIHDYNLLIYRGVEATAVGQPSRLVLHPDLISNSSLCS